MVGPLPRPRLAVTYTGGRTSRVSVRHARVLAHMAVLARHASGGRGCVFVFAERLFEPKPVHQVDVVTRPAQPGGRQLDELTGLAVHTSAGTIRIRL